MSKYTCVKAILGYMPGDIIDIKKMKHPITFSTGNKFEYVNVNSGNLISKKYIKKYFKKGAYKNEISIGILKIWFTIAMYELGKWIGREVYYKLSENDDVEVPKDFDENDHAHLNELWKKVFK